MWWSGFEVVMTATMKWNMKIFSDKIKNDFI